MPLNMTSSRLYLAVEVRARLRAVGGKGAPAQAGAFFPAGEPYLANALAQDVG
jgi:hypothetical protein